MPVRKPFGQNTLLGLSRLELLTLRLSGVHSNQLSYRPLYMLGKTRTLNFRIRSSALYPLSYEHTTGEKGFEPLPLVLETNVLPLELLSFS